MKTHPSPVHSFDSTRSAYTWATEDDFLIVMDDSLPGRRTVTNDLENIAADLFRHLGTRFWEMMFIYRDTDDKWEGVEFNRSFHPLFIGINSPDIDEAKAVMIGRRI